MTQPTTRLTCSFISVFLPAGGSENAGFELTSNCAGGQPTTAPGVSWNHRSSAIGSALCRGAQAGQFGESQAARSQHSNAKQLPACDAVAVGSSTAVGT